jgi:hypothetical protein
MPEQIFSYALDDADVNTVLVGVNLEFFSYRGERLTLINDDKCNPASIIAAINCVTFSK